MNTISTQRGGTIAGILIGLTIGFAIAIGVSLYVSKMPLPFINTNAHTRPTALDSTEQERNRTWNPNASMAARGDLPTTKTTSPARTQRPAQPSREPEAPPVEPEPPSAEVVAIAPSRTPEASSEDPLGELAARVGGRAEPEAPAAPPPSSDPYQYFVQAGAYSSRADADAQRARLAMNGWDARITSRGGQGQTIYRVRVGPFGKSQDAANIKRQFDQQGFDSAVVRQAR